MAKLQRDDAKMLWEEMGDDKSWGALVRVLEQHLEKAKGIEDSTVKALLGEVKQFQRSKDGFPETSGKMAQMLNEHLDEYRVQGKGDHKPERQTKESRENEGSRQQPKTRQASSESKRQSEEKRSQEHRGQSSARSTAGSKAAGSQQGEQQPRRVQADMQGGQRQNKSSEQKMAAPQKADESMTTAYQQAHMEILFTRGKWKNWDEIIRWLEQSGHADGAFNDREVEHLIRDLTFLRDSNVPFNPNHEQVFQLISTQSRR